jgi:DNA polymerase
MLALGASGAPAPVLLNYYGAHTGRWSGGDAMNFQNIQRGSDLRRAITAPLGFALSVVDQAQIEARMNAWLADEDELVAQFAKKVDPYIAFAKKIWPNEPWSGNDKKDAKTFKDLRFVGKTCILGLGYQMGAKRLQATMANYGAFYSMDECRDWVALYRDTYPSIESQWGTFQGMLQHLSDEDTYEYGPLEIGEGGIWLPNGLGLLYPDLTRRSTGEWTYTSLNPKTGRPQLVKIYGGYMTENVVQALSRLVISEHMVEISKHYRVVLLVHDEIVTLVPQKDAAKHHAKIVEICSVTPKWAPGLPILAEGGYDRRYSK